MARLAVLLAALSLIVALGATLTSYRVQQSATDRLDVAVCGLVKSATGASKRRQHAEVAAEKLKTLEASLPPGPALDAVKTVQTVFADQGAGSATAVKAFNAELKHLNCHFQVH